MSARDWQVRRAKGRRIYTGLSREQIERALRSGKLKADDLALPPGSDRWMPVPIALVHTGSDQAAVAAQAPPGAAAEWAPMEQEGRLIHPPAEDEDPAELDMTPMIDVTTLLLIFFLVGGVFMLQAAIDLPKARSGTPEVAAEVKPVGILIDVAPQQPLGGTIAFDDRRTDPIALDELVQRFQERLADPEQGAQYRNEALIRAHRDVPFGLVRQVMARLTEARVSRISIGVEEEREPAGREPGGERP